MTEQAATTKTITFLQMKLPPRQILYLDMDGVLVDFIGGLCRLFGTTESDLAARHEKPLPWSLEKLFGRPFAEIDAKADIGFWYNLEPYPWADEVVETVCRLFHDRVFLCTSGGNPGTSYFNRAAIGKALWVHRHYPHLADSLIFAFQKWPLAGPDKILVDDCESHVERFQANDGEAILFPQWWNSEWDRRAKGDVLDTLKRKLERVIHV